MLDSCSSLRSPDNLYNVLTHNFIRHYEQNRSIVLDNSFVLHLRIVLTSVIKLNIHSDHLLLQIGGLTPYIRKR